MKSISSNKTVLALAIASTLGFSSAAADAATVGAWVSQDSVSQNLAEFAPSGAGVGENAVINQNTAGVAFDSRNWFAYAWTAPASNDTSSASGVIGTKMSYRSGPFLLRGALSLGLTSVHQLSASGRSTAIGFDISAGEPLLSGYVRQRAIRFSGGGQSISAPILFGLTSQHYFQSLGGEVSGDVALIQPVYSGLGGAGFGDGWMARLTFRPSGYFAGARVTATLVGGENTIGSSVVGGGLVSGGIGLRDAIAVWPILPGDPASSYQRGFFLSFRTAPFLGGWTVLASGHLSPSAQATGRTATGALVSETFSSVGATLGVERQF